MIPIYYLEVSFSIRFWTMLVIFVFVYVVWMQPIWHLAWLFYVQLQDSPNTMFQLWRQRFSPELIILVMGINFQAHFVIMQSFWKNLWACGYLTYIRCHQTRGHIFTKIIPFLWEMCKINRQNYYTDHYVPKS